LIDCGFVLYQNSKLQKDTWILNIKHKVDLNNPNLFYDLLEKLWDVFSNELPTKTSIKQLPPDVTNFISLSQGKSSLTDPESLLFVLEKSTDNSPVQINLTYHHPDPEVQEEYEDSSSDSEPNFKKSETLLEKRNNTLNRNSSIKLSGSNTQSKWALGGLACESLHIYIFSLHL
jgi:hypothetical protein